MTVRKYEERGHDETHRRDVVSTVLKIMGLGTWGTPRPIRRTELVIVPKRTQYVLSEKELTKKRNMFAMIPRWLTLEIITSWKIELNARSIFRNTVIAVSTLCLGSSNEGASFAIQSAVPRTERNPQKSWWRRWAPSRNHFIATEDTAFEQVPHARYKWDRAMRKTTGSVWHDSAWEKPERIPFRCEQLR